MDETFKIYFEQLKGGKIEKIDATFTPEFLSVEEESLHFKDPVQLKGEAYLADDALILHLDAETVAVIPCSICNEPVKVPVEIHSFYHAEDIEGLKNGYFNFKEILREALLLEVPAFAECSKGNCPKRKEIVKFLKNPTSTEENGNRPFADINLDQFKP
ncbi:MAG: hypothetical protein H0T62_01885 [Parachlamydiaceae bacterium]|nr:hypothetical protein [Parachlamydiaceae bacterium]